MIRQVKPPALFSVDLSNVPAASCSIIMASSPLLLRRQCLSPLGPLLSLRLSPTLFLHHHRLVLPAFAFRLIVFSFSFVLPRSSFTSSSSSTPSSSSLLSRVAPCPPSSLPPPPCLAMALHPSFSSFLFVGRTNAQRANSTFFLFSRSVHPERRPRRHGNEDNEDRL